MALLNRKSVVAVKNETSGEHSGTTGATLAGSNGAFNIFEASFSPEVEQFERNPFRSSIGRRTSIAGVRTGTISFTTELVGSGSAGTAPPFAPLLLPCGFLEKSVTKFAGTISGTFEIGESVSQGSGLTAATVVAVGTDVLYVIDTSGTPGAGTITGADSSATMASPTTTSSAGKCYQSRTAPSTYSATDVPTATVGMYTDGIRHQLIHARGNATIRVATGQPAQLQMEFVGPYDNSTDQTLLTPTYPTNTPPTLLNAGFTTQGFAGVIDNLEIATNNELAIRRDANAASGVRGTEIVARAMTGSIDPEATLMADHNWFDKLESNTTGSLQVEVSAGSGAAGNQFFLSSPNVQYTGISGADRNGIAVNQVELALNESSAGDDDLFIVSV